MSLYTDADRARAAAIEAEAQKLAAELSVKTVKFVAEAFDKELLKFHEEERVVGLQIFGEHPELLVRRYERRAKLHSVPKQERHMFSGPAEIEPRDFQGKRGIVGVFVA